MIDKSVCTYNTTLCDEIQLINEFLSQIWFAGKSKTRLSDQGENGPPGSYGYNGVDFPSGQNGAGSNGWSKKLVAVGAG
jgi:hypothetical protein